MSLLTIHPGASLSGTVTLPGDKSLSHRAALFAALAEGESRIGNFLQAGVTDRMLEALSNLGVAWALENNELRVTGRGLTGFQPPSQALDCGNSATTIRLLAGAVAASGVPATLDGSTGLRKRPMGRIVAPLQQMGLPIQAADGEFAPLTIAASAGQPLTPLTYTLPVASAQVKTCLLLAALAASGATTLVEPGPSRDHTERMLNSMGVLVETTLLPGGRVQVALTPPKHPLRPLDMTLPGDISSAAFLIVAALITPGSDVLLPGVGLNPTRTGLLDALTAMGGDISILNPREQGGEPMGDLHVRASRLHGVEISGSLVVRMIDEFPVFAAAAALAKEPTRVSGAEELRHKESDRISALVRQLNAVGIPAGETPDGFTLPGETPARGGEVHPQGDHRIAMSLAVAGLAADGPVTIHQAEIIHESFPEFAGALAGLGANLEAAA